jgi:serine/threonine protein kinase
VFLTYLLKDVDKRQRARGTDLCVQLLAHFQFQGHFCLVFESLGRSLYDYLKKNEYRPFPFPMVVSFTKQMLEAVDFLHTMDLCHTDLKPENVLAVTTAGEHYVESGYPGDNSKVLVPASTKIKVIDFGGATYDNDDHKSSVVNTRQYRAPEVCVGHIHSKLPSVAYISCLGSFFFPCRPLSHRKNMHVHKSILKIEPF